MLYPIDHALPEDLGGAGEAQNNHEDPEQKLAVVATWDYSGEMA